MIDVDFIEIFRGTAQIFAFYAIMILVIIYLVCFSEKVEARIEKLNKIIVSKEDSKFKQVYLAIAILSVITFISIALISFKDLRATNFEVFAIFAIFAFWILPIALGLLGVYSFILKRGTYRLGDALLLTICFASFGMIGSNFHDVLWCGTVTNWYQTEKIAGADIALYFNTFGIFDGGRYDYRTFGLFMVIQIVLELTIGTTSLYKYYKIDKSRSKKGNKAKYIKIFGLLLLAGLVLGTIEFVFDYPWAFTDLEYAIDVWLGIPISALIFFGIGRYFAKSTDYNLS